MISLIIKFLGATGILYILMIIRMFVLITVAGAIFITFALIFKFLMSPSVFFEDGNRIIVTAIITTATAFFIFFLAVVGFATLLIGFCVVCSILKSLFSGREILEKNSRELLEKSTFIESLGIGLNRCGVNNISSLIINIFKVPIAFVGMLIKSLVYGIIYAPFFLLGLLGLGSGGGGSSKEESDWSDKNRYYLKTEHNILGDDRQYFTKEHSFWDSDHQHLKRDSDLFGGHEHYHVKEKDGSWSNKHYHLEKDKDRYYIKK